MASRKPTPKDKKGSPAVSRKVSTPEVSRRPLLNVGPGEGAARNTTVGPPGVPVNEAQLVLMVVAPYRAFAYWDMDERVLDLARSWVGDPAARTVLRFQDLGLADVEDPPESPFFDVDVSGHRGSYHIDLWSPGKALVAEYGVISSEGAFAAIVRSTEIELPNDEESERYENRPQRLHSPVSPLWKTRRWIPNKTANSAEADASTADPEAAVRSAQDEASRDARTPEYEGQEAQATGPLQMPDDWESGIGTSSAELAGENFSSLSVFERDGRLEVDIQADVVVRGRTQPGTELYIEGRLIPLNSDGSFFLRFTVPRAVPPAGKASGRTDDSSRESVLDDPLKS